VSRYGNIIYGGGARYGDTPKLAYSVEPMTLNVLRFNEAYVGWQNPFGSFTRFRIVRNQNGFPETAEDGVVVYEVNSSDGSNLSGTLSKTVLKDGEENTSISNFVSIVPGKNLYYRVFLYTNQKVWVKAGEIQDVVPFDTDAMSKMINLLPRTLVSDVLSPFGVVPQKTDEAKSDVYNFLDAFAFTYEQMLTQTKLLVPNTGVESSNYLTIPAETYSVGRELESNLPIVNQRRLIRDAIYLYSKKGTAVGLKNYAESLTGFNTIVTESPNLLLSVQDSTFYKSTGNWAATNATISYTDELLPDTSVTNCVDKVYTLKIVASSAGNITLGASSPVTQAVPITPGNHYTYSFKLKSPTSAGSVTPAVTFYDADDNAVYTVPGSSVSANNTWEIATQTVNADEADIGAASYAGLKISWSAAGTYYVDMVCFQVGTSAVYDEARAVTVLLEPAKENYIENPSFEVDSSGWTLTGLSFSQDPTNFPLEGYPSIHSGKFTATATTWELSNTSAMPVDPGTYFNVSMYAYSDSIPMMDMYIDVFDADDNLITSFQDTHMMGPMWMRHYVGGLMDINTNPNHAHVRFVGTANIGDSFNIDMIQAQDTYVPTDYFDGSMPASVGVIWEGAANASPSLYYPGKDTKFLRLAQTMMDWVSMNTWWRIITPAGLEYTNLDV